MDQMEEKLEFGKAGWRPKLLIVEDNEINRQMLKELLQDDYDIEEATDGNEGFAILKSKYRELSIIILDLVMPNCDGFQFLKKVKDNPKLSNVPIAVLTACSDKSQEEQCLELGAVDFLTKPFNPTIIKARLHNIIRMRELAASLNAIEFDELTGLYTKQAFFYRAKKLLEANPDVSYEVVISDIENFKLINASYGMDKGDELLKRFADYSAECCSDGICGRYGADQIISMYKTPSPDEVEAFKIKFQKFKESAPVPNVLIKYGIYRNVDRNLTIPAICDRALLALRSVKHNYNRTSAMYDGPLSQHQLKEHIYESRFQEAIQNREFTVWYQPKYDVDTKIMVGAEALVRWQTSDGMVPPGDFLDVFESNGMIRQLDEYVFRSVCEYQKRRKEKGCKLIPISVNMSRGSLFGYDVVKQYKKILDECGIRPENVPIEITENTTITSNRIKEVADAFSEEGFCLHMDDFGSGRSSLNGLNILHFDVIKLDKSLIDYIGDKSGDLILKHTMALAKELGLSIVAEGVENEKQFKFVKEIGCDTIQGFYFSRPLPLEEFEKTVEENLKQYPC